MKMAHGLKTLASSLSLLLCLTGNVDAKTLKVDAITPSVTNGDMTITSNGTGDIVLGTFSGVLKATSGVISVSSVDLTSEITGILPVANGGTNSNTALNNNFVMVSTTGAIAESSAITTTELGLLDGLLAPILTTTSTSVLTNKDYDGGTASNSLRMTLPKNTTGNLAALTRKEGTIFYDSTLKTFHGDDGTDVVDLGGGGGGGGSLLNLIVDPSFETDVSEGTCTTCTASQETTIVELTSLNLASLKMAFSASVGDYTDTTTTSSQYTGVVGLASARIKTDQEGIEFCSMVDGAESACTAVRSDDVWDTYKINSTMSSTSFGYKIKATASITGNIYADEIFAGSNPIETVVTQQKPQHYIISQAGNALTDRTSEIEFNLGTATIEDSGQGYLVASDDSGNTRTKFTATTSGIVIISGALRQLNANTVTGIYKNGAKFGDWNDQATAANAYTSLGSSVPVVNGDYITIFSDSGVANDTTVDHVEFTFIPDQNKAVIVSVDDDSKTDWVDYTPTFAGYGTRSTEDARWRKDGQDMIISATFVMSGTGSASDATFTLPSGYTIDTTLTPLAMLTGTVGWFDAGTANEYVQYGGYQGTNKITAIPNGLGGNVTQGNELVSGDYMRFLVRVPIVGWSSRATALATVPVEENKTETYRARTFAGYSTNNTKIPYFTTVDYNGVSALGSVTNTSADGFFFTAAERVEFIGTASGSRSGANSFEIAWTVNGTPAQLDTSVLSVPTIVRGGAIHQTTTETVNPAPSVATVLNAGDKIYLHTNAGSWSVAAYYGVSFTVKPANPKVFLGNVNPTTHVTTPSSVKPVIYSAYVNGSGTISNEVGAWINGNASLTDTSLFTFTLDSGAFLTAPNCTMNAVTGGVGATYSILHSVAPTASTLVIRMGYSTSANSFVKQANIFNIICHGVQ